MTKRNRTTKQIEKRVEKITQWRNLEQEKRRTTEDNVQGESIGSIQISLLSHVRVCIVATGKLYSSSAMLNCCMQTILFRNSFCSDTGTKTMRGLADRDSAAPIIKIFRNIFLSSLRLSPSIRHESSKLGCQRKQFGNIFRRFKHF